MAVSKEDLKTRQQAALASGLRLRQRIVSEGIDEEAGAPARVRMLVGAVDQPQDRLATARTFFPDAAFDPKDPESLLFTNPETGRLTRLNPRGFDLGDVAGVGRELTQAAGSMVGTAVGLAGGLPGAVVGAGLGAAAGEEVFNLFAQALGTRDTRDIVERARDLTMLGILSAAGEAGGVTLGQAIRSGTKFVLRGGKEGRKAAEQAIADLTDLGATPSMAQATNNTALDMLETAVSRVPGGIGPIRRAVDATNQAVQEGIEGIVTRTTGRAASTVDPTAAGVAVRKGIIEFADDFKLQALSLSDDLQELIPSTKQVPLGNTLGAFRNVTQPVPGAPNVSEALTPAAVRRFNRALRRDITQQGMLPFKAALDLHTAIGQKITDDILVLDRVDEPLRQVFRALTEDLLDATAAHSDEAARLFNRQAKFTLAGLARLEDRLEPLIKNRVPERIFEALATGGKKGASDLRAVRQSVSPEQWRVVAGAMVRRLGQAGAGQETLEGGAFSFNQFLRNWNNLDARAKDVLFEGIDTLREDLDKIARAAGRIKASSPAFLDPSGPTTSFIGQAGSAFAVGSGILGVLSGSANFLWLPAAWGLVMGGANVAARIMTSPKAVRWLADAATIAPKGWGAHFGRLAGIAANSDLETREAINEWLRNIDEIFQAVPETQATEPANG